MAIMVEPRDNDGSLERRGSGGAPTRGARRAKQSKSPYFLKPAGSGAVTVFRRPAGNRIDPKDCGTMPSRTAAAALVAQLQRAESVVHDLFLEATDDGIEALEAILITCREAVMKRYANSKEGQGGRNSRRRRRRGDRRAAARRPCAPR
jgi:hypothetical protein